MSRRQAAPPLPAGLSGRLGKRAASLLPLCGFLLGCSSAPTVTEVTPPPTAVLVRPSDFLGQQLCRELEGAMRVYQATLVDVTDELEEPFTLASSAVLSCNSSVYFTHVTPGHRYIAHIQAFDRSDLSAQRPGTSIVVDPQGKSVSPRWTTTCWGDEGEDHGAGGANGANVLGVEAQLNTDVYVRACDPLLDTGEPGETGVRLSLENSLVGLSCGDKAGQVERFEIRSNASPTEPEVAQGGAGGFGGDGGTEPPPTEPAGAACTESITLVGLEPGRSVLYTLDAFESGKTEPSYTTTCRAFTAQGVIIPASCGPLQPISL